MSRKSPSPAEMAPRATTIRASPSTGNIEPGASPNIAASMPARASSYTHEHISARRAPGGQAKGAHRRRDDVPLRQEPREHLVEALRARVVVRDALRLEQLRVRRDAVEHALAPRERDPFGRLAIPREELRLARAVRAIHVHRVEHRGAECGLVRVDCGWEVSVARCRGTGRLYGDGFAVLVLVVGVETVAAYATFSPAEGSGRWDIRCGLVHCGLRGTF